MVIVAGHITVEPQERESYLTGCVSVVKQARGTAGCLDFAITADLIDPGRVNIFERWESQAAVDAFRSSGPSDEQGAAMLSASVAEYDIADVRLVTGERASGKIRFVAKTATATTRTYRVEIELPNPDGRIPDGITAEVSLPLAPVLATRVPRSALTFSSAGNLGVRAVRADETVEFVPVSVVEDEQSFMWLTGIVDGSRVIVQGQDFVREGQKVDAVPAPELTAIAR